MHGSEAQSRPYDGLSQRDDLDVARAEASMRSTVDSLVTRETYGKLDEFVRTYVKLTTDRDTRDLPSWIPEGALLSPGLLFDNDTRASSVVNRVLSIMTRSSDIERGRLPQLDRRHRAFSQAYLDSRIASNPYMETTGDGKERARRVYLTETLRQVRTKEIDVLARQTLQAWDDRSAERFKWLEAFERTPELPAEVRTMRNAATVLYAIIRQTRPWLTDKSMDMFVRRLCELAQKDASFASAVRAVFDQRKDDAQPTLRERLAAFACWSAAAVRFKNSVEHLHGAALTAGVGALALASTPRALISTLASDASVRGGETAATLSEQFLGPLFARELCTSLVSKAAEDLTSLQASSDGNAVPAQMWSWQVTLWLQEALPALEAASNATHRGESWLSVKSSLPRLLERAVACSRAKSIRAGDYVGYSCPLKLYQNFVERRQRHHSGSAWELKQWCDLRAAEAVQETQSAEALSESGAARELFREVHERRWRVVLRAALRGASGLHPEPPPPWPQFDFYGLVKEATSTGDERCTPPSSSEANRTLLLEMRSGASERARMLQRDFRADRRKLESSLD